MEDGGLRFRRWSNPPLMLAVLTALVSVHLAAGPPPTLVRVVAYDGMLAPGLSAGTQIALPLGTGGFEPHPVINNAGQVAFPAQLESSDSALNAAWSIWTEASGGLNAIAIEGQVPSGIADVGAEYTTLGRRVLIDETGHTAFNGSWQDGSGTFRQGIWVGQPDGTVRNVVVTGMIAPNAPAGHVFTRLGFEPNFWTWHDAEVFLGGGRVAFFADIVDDASAASPKPGALTGIWSEGGSDASRQLGVVARTGADTTFGEPDLEGMNRVGWPVFNAAIFPQDDPSFDSIWSGSPPAMVTRTGTESDAVNFSALGVIPSINPYCARLAFTARVSDEPADQDTGIFAQILADASPAAFEGSVAAGLPDLSGDGIADFLFSDFLTVEPLMNGRGVVAFKQRAATPDQSQQFTGIWVFDPFGQLQLVARTGAQAPGLPPGTEFTAVAPFENMVLNNRDQLAFTADFETADGTTGRGLWMWDGERASLLIKSDPDPTPGAMVQPDTIPLPDGSTMTSNILVFSGGNGSAGAAHGSGRLSGFSDKARVAVYVYETGSGRGAVIELAELVFDADFETPPQPDSDPAPGGGCLG